MQPDPFEPLVVGAEAISSEVFQGRLSRRQVYRSAEDGWPFIRVRGKLACRPSAVREHIQRLEREAAAAPRAA